VHVAAIINPISGAGMDPAVADRRVAILRAELGRRGLRATIAMTERPGHARQLAAAAVAERAALLIVWGGDGTINEAGAALVGTSTALAVIPAGSGNGLAGALSVPREPAAALAVALGERSRAIDVGTIAGRPFFNVAGIGFDARIAVLFNQRAKGTRGRWPYIVIGVREGCRYCAREYRVQLDAERQQVRALLMTFANGSEYGMGARIAPKAQLDDGLLDAVIVEDRPLLARFWDARHLAAGSVHLAPRVTTRQVQKAVVEAEGTLEFHVDGEPGVAHDRLEIGVLPRALTVKG
jgi:diacylglycerol kinase (ATP)